MHSVLPLVKKFQLSTAEHFRDLFHTLGALRIPISKLEPKQVAVVSGYYAHVIRGALCLLAPADLADLLPPDGAVVAVIKDLAAGLENLLRRAEGESAFVRVREFRVFTLGGEWYPSAHAAARACASELCRSTAESWGADVHERWSLLSAAMEQEYECLWEAASEGAPEQIDGNEEEVLRQLRLSHPRLIDQQDIATATAISRKTVGITMRKLLKKNLAACPGQRKGWGITSKGMSLLNSIGAQTTR